MKKLVPFALAASALLLAGCFNFGGKSTPTSGDPSSQGGSSQPESANIVIDRAALGLDADGNAVYPTTATSFQAGGKAFTATTGVGVCLKKYNEGGYYDLACMQFNKQAKDDGTRDRGAILNDAALSGYTSVECVWYATYAKEGTQYFPVVKQGSAAGSLSAVAADQTDELTGQETGKVHNDNGTQRPIYKYTTTYTITGSFFSLEGPSGGAGYIGSYTFKK